MVLSSRVPRPWRLEVSSAAVHRVLRILMVGHIVFPLMWVAAVLQNGPLQNDWWHFRLTGTAFVSGEWGHIYHQDPASEHPGYFWRYPPFALYFVAPLAWLTPIQAYLAIVSVSIAALVLGCRHLAAGLSERARAYAYFAVLLSAPALTTVVTGQLSGLLFGAIVLASAQWERRRPVAAGAALGLLAIKPNLALFFGGFVVMRGEWRALAGMAASAGILVLSTVPLGMAVWAAFYQSASSNSDILGTYPPYKLITLQGFFSGWIGNARFVSVISWLMGGVLVVVAARAWRTAAPVTRQLSWAVLLAVAANPYLSFYDALILVYPAFVWWFERNLWRRRPWMFVGWLMGATWLAEHIAHSWTPGLELVGAGVVPPFSLVGPASAIWLIVSVIESRRISSGAAATQ